MTTESDQESSSIRRPRNLGDQGSALWEAIAGVYELRPDERRILADACREADIIERLEDELAVSELMVTGSMGQMVASPLVSEVRQHRATLKTLLAALKIPDSPAGEARKKTVVSEKARAAVRARWGSGTGTA